MSRFVRNTLLSVAISLLMIQGAWAKAYRHEATGIVFHDRVATLEKNADVTDYEATEPGLGISVGYNGPGITVTVYVYTMGMKTIPTDLHSSILKEHFEQVSGEIVRAGEMGYYSNVKKISDDEVAWDDTETGTKSLHASYRYTQSGHDRLSHIYLLGHQNHFFKIRFTYHQEVQEVAERAQKEFLAQFSRILGGGGEALPNDREPTVPAGERKTAPIPLEVEAIATNHKSLSIVLCAEGNNA